MPFPENIETKLEFDQIKDLLRKKCLSQGAEEYIQRIRFQTRADIVLLQLEQVNEFLEIVRLETTFPSENYHYLPGIFHRVKPELTFLTETELLKILQVLLTINQLIRFFTDKKGKYIRLEKILSDCIKPDEIIRKIDRIIDREGVMKPHASTELLRISSSIAEKEKDIRRIVQRIFNHAQQQNWLADTGISIRDDRLVLPVIAEYKKQVNGFVHDESHSGQTLYIEPAEAFDTNNRIRELKLAYKREKEKILTELTTWLRPYFESIEKAFSKLYLLDFIRAKALLAADFDAHLPIIKKQAIIRLFSATHPLLKLHLAKVNQRPIPLNVQLSDDKRILVISGPNAGGKSVCMKTIGLLQYMLQCGFLVSCEAHSEFYIFQDIMVDLGDEQSIENDISTYSSHLKNMRHFIQKASKKTLFLIDEFGTGTDPQFGGPLAEAVLYELNACQSFGVLTTHYSNLKHFASTCKGLENASMLFDSEQMQPLFVLEQGKPGSSYAFELAQKSGLPTSVIQYAKQRAGFKQKKVDDILADLEREQKKLREIRERYTERDKKSIEMQEKYEALLKKYEEDKQQRNIQAKQEALAIVSEANSKIEKLIRDLKEQKDNKEIHKIVRKEIAATKEHLKVEIQKNKEVKASKIKTQKEVLAVGDWVKMEGQSLSGQIEKIERSNAIVRFGEIPLKVNIKQLIWVEEKNQAKQNKPATSNVNQAMQEKMQHFSDELNVVGIRSDEAIKQVQKFVDEAYLLGFKRVRIVHGKGYGILRKMIRQFLQGTHFIDSIENDHIDNGGDGVTIVQFNA